MLTVLSLNTLVQNMCGETAFEVRSAYSLNPSLAEQTLPQNYPISPLRLRQNCVAAGFSLFLTPDLIPEGKF